ncbi:MAG: nucleotidyltransferase [Paludibacteraceae bacterium]|nr:nucleotidyltransferase [Paludibacteraceae bacterium]MBQ9705609.1 nucleotidyltransferase [Paludibacteraceae bacterium]
MKPTLFILAAGMGSRYGGLKQLDGLGPNGETIMDYSVFDALRAGFGRIVFVIRKDFEEDFRKVVLSKYADKVPCDVCFQSIDKVPSGFSIPAERTKPWGTNHALLMAKGLINEPFAVINADDFYGKESFEVLADFLCSVEGKKNEYCMAGYRVGNTLSENGSVNRGICQTDSEGYLTDVVERTNIEEVGGKIVFKDEAGNDVELEPDVPVSMNMWGFTPEYFDYSESAFAEFLRQHGTEPKAEIYIPTVVNDLIKRGVVRCRVLDTPARWFGVTYAQDRPQVVMKLNELIRKGVYPEKLF